MDILFVILLSDQCNQTLNPAFFQCEKVLIWSNKADVYAMLMEKRLDKSCCAAILLQYTIFDDLLLFFQMSRIKNLHVRNALIANHAAEHAAGIETHGVLALRIQRDKAAFAADGGNFR